MPLAREQDRDGQANPRHVAVERLEKARALRVVRGDERIDEHHRVLRLPVDTTDVAVPVVACLPVRVRSGPPPQPVVDALHLHCSDRSDSTWEQGDRDTAEDTSHSFV